MPRSAALPRDGRPEVAVAGRSSEAAAASTDSQWQLHRRLPTGLAFNTSRRRQPEPGCKGAPRAVCEFTLRGDYLNIFHSAQILFKCWTFFHTLEQEGVEVSGRVLRSLAMPHGYPSLMSRRWQADLARAMDAEYEGPAGRAGTPPDGARCSLVWASPHVSMPRVWGSGEADSFFGRPEDAWELTRRVLGRHRPHAGSEALSAALRRYDRGPRVVRVGVLTRNHVGRTWLEEREFLAAARQQRRDRTATDAMADRSQVEWVNHHEVYGVPGPALTGWPAVEIESWAMDNMTLREQAGPRPSPGPSPFALAPTPT